MAEWSSSIVSLDIPIFSILITLMGGPCLGLAFKKHPINIYQHTVIPFHELKWMCWLGTQFQEQGHVCLFCNARGKMKELAYCCCLCEYHLPQRDLGRCALEDAPI